MNQTSQNSSTSTSQTTAVATVASPEHPVSSTFIPPHPFESETTAPVAGESAGPRWPLWIGIGVTGCLVAALSGVAATYYSWRGGEQIIANTFVAGEPVGGMTRHEARQILEQRYGNLSLTIRASEKDYKLSLEELGGTPDINRAINDAYWFGRTGSILQNVPRVLMARGEEQQVRLPVRWNKERLKNRMRAVAKEFDTPGRDATLVVEGSGVRVVAERAGREMNVGETLARLQKRYHFGLTEFDATVRATQPRLTAADLQGTDLKLDQYTTSFNRGLVGRTRNIRVAAEAVDGMVLMPGDTFSFNRATGQRTWAKGYRMAQMFERKPGKEESEIVDALAGGVCQVSSTLYNAVRKSNRKMDSGLKIVQRESHSLPVTYVPPGLDATVAWPNRDFKFRNKLTHPVYLRAGVSGSRLTISVWARVPHDTALRLAKAEDL